MIPGQKGSCFWWICLWWGGQVCKQEPIPGDTVNTVTLWQGHVWALWEQRNGKQGYCLEILLEEKTVILHSENWAGVGLKHQGRKGISDGGCSLVISSEACKGTQDCLKDRARFHVTILQTACTQWWAVTPERRIRAHTLRVLKITLKG